MFPSQPAVRPEGSEFLQQYAAHSSGVQVCRLRPQVRLHLHHPSDLSDELWKTNNPNPSICCGVKHISRITLNFRHQPSPIFSHPKLPHADYHWSRDTLLQQDSASDVVECLFGLQVNLHKLLKGMKIASCASDASNL